MYNFPFPSAISTGRDSIDLISRLDRSHFPFQCNFPWPRLDSIINLISQSMMTQIQGNLVRIISGCRAGRRATRDVLEIFGIIRHKVRTSLQHNGGIMCRNAFRHNVQNRRHLAGIPILFASPLGLAHNFTQLLCCYFGLPSRKTLLPKV